MAVNLSKGQKVDLTKGAPSLSKLRVELRWDTQRYDGDDFDLDASAFLLSGRGKVSNDADFIYYNNLSHFSGGVRHGGDNLTGGGEGEVIEVDLSLVPPSVERIAFAVTIYDYVVRGQNFGQVENSSILVIDDVTHKELIRYELGENFSTETAVVIGEIYRNNGEWKFNAVGSGFQGGLYALCQNFGVNV